MRHVAEFINSKSTGLPRFAILKFSRPRKGSRRWRGVATPVLSAIRIFWPKTFVYLPKDDYRFPDRHLSIKWDIRNRAESFVFLLAHEIRHLSEQNRKLFKEENGYYLSEYDANVFGQWIVNQWRKEIGWKKLRVVRKIQLFKIMSRKLKQAATERDVS